MVDKSSTNFVHHTVDKDEVDGFTEHINFYSDVKLHFNQKVKIFFLSRKIKT